jgi:hypothetical protein
MWTYVVIIGFLIGAFTFVLTPLFREEDRRDELGPKRSDLLEELKTKKEAAYAAIREMEFDYNMGKLTEEDFAILKRQYLEEAAGYMKEMDALAEGSDVFSASEGIRAAEENQDEKVAGRAERPTPEKDAYCTSCGKKAASKNRFCTGCGASLKPGRGEG